MNIIEALKTGRPMRRKSWVKGLYQNPSLIESFTTEHVLADDWEVQPEIVEISRDDFYTGVAEWAKASYHVTRPLYLNQSTYVDIVLQGVANLWEELKAKGKLK